MTVMTVYLFLAAILGILIGFGLAWFRSQKIRFQLETNLKVLEERIQNKESQTQALLAQERESAAEKLRLLEEAEAKLANTFKALSAETLKSSNASFLELAQSTLARFQEQAKGDLEKREQSIQQLVKPVHESLSKFDQKIQDLEKVRVGAYEGLIQQVKLLAENQNLLKQETHNLVRALANPRVRGRWGEIQLKRVVELAGMSQHCDFQEQASVEAEAGRLRPDLIVKLPLGKTIVVDAKAPLSAYLEAMESSDENVKQDRLKHHARLVRSHVQELTRKAYWDQFKNAPEFVVMFLPGESFYNAALEQDPELIEYAVSQNVIPATPTTLISLLKAVAYGWRQEALQKNAQEISAIGKDLYKRVADLSLHFSDLGQRLGKAVDSYNKAVGTLETRVLASARKFRDLEVQDSSSQIENLEPLASIPRALQAPELNKLSVPEEEH